MRRAREETDLALLEASSRSALEASAEFTTAALSRHRGRPDGSPRDADGSPGPSSGGDGGLLTVDERSASPEAVHPEPAGSHPFGTGEEAGAEEARVAGVAEETTPPRHPSDETARTVVEAPAHALQALPSRRVGFWARSLRTARRASRSGPKNPAGQVSYIAM